MISSDVGPWSIIPRWLLDSEVSHAAIKLYAILADHADRETSEATVSRKALARRLGQKAPASVDTVDRAKNELIEIGALVVVPRFDEVGGERVQRANAYVVRMADPSRTGAATPSDGRGGGGGMGAAPKNKNQKNKNQEASVSRARERDGIRKVWADTPGLIQHTAGYYGKSEVKTRMNKALDTYPLTDIEEAIAAYGAVLESPDHFWEHHWTLEDFLRRGLDRFVPAAKPLENFRVREMPKAKPKTKGAGVEKLGYTKA